ncbi:MAG TPA: hypothetical protein VMY88_00690 [Acidimicrobiales bacterium]|nr:hypothetical protein [Acidimicrobiales bacterium]
MAARRWRSVLAAILLSGAAACGAAPAEELSEADAFGAAPPMAQAERLSAPENAAESSVPQGAAQGSNAGHTSADGRAESAARNRAAGEVGSFAPALLQEDLVVELLAQQGAAPDPAALEHLKASLSRVTGRDVPITAPTALPGGARAWRGPELIGLADQHAIRPPGSATIRMVFVHGHAENRPQVMGAALRGDVAVVFMEKVGRAGGLLGNSTDAQRKVMLHEAGHLLGLVDNYLATGRGDPESPSHSPNPDSVMYSGVDTTVAGQFVGEDWADEFDEDDLADLAAIKGGAPPG